MWWAKSPCKFGGWQGGSSHSFSCEKDHCESSATGLFAVWKKYEGGVIGGGATKSRSKKRLCQATSTSGDIIVRPRRLLIVTETLINCIQDRNIVGEPWLMVTSPLPLHPCPVHVLVGIAVSRLVDCFSLRSYLLSACAPYRWRILGHGSGSSGRGSDMMIHMIKEDDS